ncbi:unnamed protein product [Ambrosiozyma monospora]|uniref:Unnamed protein product n=1 Tax=Ambrosiozyma monospora TaxID=43982 RepID=A0A9W6Z219_AMBMO|nr:unnamed protein product [Ambrosiozyma monospora]
MSYSESEYTIVPWLIDPQPIMLAHNTCIAHFKKTLLQRDRMVLGKPSARFFTQSLKQSNDIYVPNTTHIEKLQDKFSQFTLQDWVNPKLSSSNPLRKREALKIQREQSLKQKLAQLERHKTWSDVKFKDLKLNALVNVVVKEKIRVSSDANLFLKGSLKRAPIKSTLPLEKLPLCPESSIDNFVIDGLMVPLIESDGAVVKQRKKDRIKDSMIRMVSHWPVDELNVAMLNQDDQELNHHEFHIPFQEEKKFELISKDEIGAKLVVELPMLTKYKRNEREQMIELIDIPAFHWKLNNDETLKNGIQASVKNEIVQETLDKRELKFKVRMPTRSTESEIDEQHKKEDQKPSKTNHQVSSLMVERIFSHQWVYSKLKIAKMSWSPFKNISRTATLIEDLDAIKSGDVLTVNVYRESDDLKIIKQHDLECQEEEDEWISGTLGNDVAVNMVDVNEEEIEVGKHGGESFHVSVTHYQPRKVVDSSASESQIVNDDSKSAKMSTKDKLITMLEEDDEEIGSILPANGITEIKSKIISPSKNRDSTITNSKVESANESQKSTIIRHTFSEQPTIESPFDKISSRSTTDQSTIPINGPGKTKKNKRKRNNSAASELDSLVLKKKKKVANSLLNINETKGFPILAALNYSTTFTEDFTNPPGTPDVPDLPRLSPELVKQLGNTSELDHPTTRKSTMNTILGDNSINGTVPDIEVMMDDIRPGSDSFRRFGMNTKLSETYPSLYLQLINIGERFNTSLAIHEFEHVLQDTGDETAMTFDFFISETCGIILIRPTETYQIDIKTGESLFFMKLSEIAFNVQSLILVMIVDVNESNILSEDSKMTAFSEDCNSLGIQLFTTTTDPKSMLKTLHDIILNYGCVVTSQNSGRLVTVEQLEDDMKYNEEHRFLMDCGLVNPLLVKCLLEKIDLKDFVMMSWDEKIELFGDLISDQLMAVVENNFELALQQQSVM